MQESPDPSPISLASALCALVGVLARSSPERAALLVRDLVLSQLAEQQVADLWSPPEPWTTLQDVLARDKRAAPEPRLVFEAGTGTLLGAYCVAVFSDKQLLGKGDYRLWVEMEDLAFIGYLVKMK